MSHRWTWTFADAREGAMVDPPTTSAPFPTQSDAENWFGETWRQLAEAGVASATLHRDGEIVYGPMSLDPAP